MGFVTLPVVGVFSSLLQVSSSDGATSLIFSVSDSDATSFSSQSDSDKAPLSNDEASVVGCFCIDLATFAGGAGRESLSTIYKTYFQEISKLRLFDPSSYYISAFICVILSS